MACNRLGEDFPPVWLCHAKTLDATKIDQINMIIAILLQFNKTNILAMEIYFVQPIVESSFDFHQSFAFAFYNGE